MISIPRTLKTTPLKPIGKMGDQQQEKLATKKIFVDAEKEVEQGGHIIEDEEETKRSRGNKPEWKRYYHLVVIAKNQKGLANLFTLVKKSYKHGFYRFPRIDYKLLKEHGEGLVVSTACVGGLASGLIYKQFPTLRFDDGSLATIAYTALGDGAYPKEMIEIFADGTVIESSAEAEENHGTRGEVLGAATSAARADCGRVVATGLRGASLLAAASAYS